MSYGSNKKHPTRFELASSVWKTDVLPLNYGCNSPLLRGVAENLGPNPPATDSEATRQFLRNPLIFAGLLYVGLDFSSLLSCRYTGEISSPEICMPPYSRALA